MQYIEELDEMDNKILNAIEKDARLSYSDIGELVGLSRVAVKNRIQVLEEKGIIVGYHTIINTMKSPQGRKFILEVFAETDKVEMVMDNIGKYEVIRKIYAVSGSSGHIYAEGYAPTQMRYEMFTKSVKHNHEGIKNLYIYDVQYTVKDTDGGINDYGEKL